MLSPKGLLKALRLCTTAAIVAAPLVTGGGAIAQEKVLRAVLHADVRVLDPHWTTATIAGIHGALVYDTLFGNDKELKPQPQMVGKYEISPDKLTYTFTLRDGLEFHDGQPVTSKDVIPSIRRWAARDAVGQKLFGFVDKWEAIDDKSFRMVLKKPYGMVLESLGKTGTSVPVIMREQDANTDPKDQIKTAIGSGPFKFAADQWVPGSKTVYLKNPKYVSRPGKEPASFFAGSKYPGVDKIELVWISDPQTAMSALVNGEIDFYENPNVDFYPILEKTKGVKLETTGDIDSHHGMIRLNHLHPPFNNPKARQAMYHLINQEDFLRAVIGDPKYYRICHGLITCGTTLANDGGSQWFKEYNPKKALQLMKEAGYNGEPIVVLATTDHNTITPATQVLIQAMREAGLNVDAQAMDWGTTVTRRAKKDPPDKGGWNIFVTTTGGVSSSNPILHIWLGAACDKGMFGWPCNEKVEALRDSFGFADSLDERKRISKEIQTLAMEDVVYIPFGQWNQLIGYRADRLTPFVPNTGLVVLWNIEKK
ncbi:MAG TPA: ABC transporter substrate-binding protein [Hyphomicrobiaceae bacterium]|nr:ABC transporter substrate-binding protein [Hyphomicrobiaceae bacterium]